MVLKVGSVDPWHMRCRNDACSMSRLSMSRRRSRISAPLSCNIESTTSWRHSGRLPTIARPRAVLRGGRLQVVSSSILTSAIKKRTISRRPACHRQVTWNRKGHECDVWLYMFKISVPSLNTRLKIAESSLEEKECSSCLDQPCFEMPAAGGSQDSKDECQL